MKAKQLMFQRLPILLATSVLGTGLLLSGCSNSTDSSNDSKTDSVKTEKVTTDSPASATETVSKTINPTAAAAKQPSLLTNSTEAGSAEDTVKLALDTLYYGDAKKAAAYYQVDMANFEEELKNTQFTFQQTVDSVTIIETKYNKEKTRATVIGELKLKNQSEPAPLSYILQKIDGQWKILG
ncbi:hypothetical protein [Psychrobacter urativorans]|uniref:DUF4878 domain-containing protein n=1 Tax=Psychrobacter urativorans TaxID=45610 RepID=A0A0M5MNB0_9GAMM|nr:hypothetical protein [Psychrobacter urativorans]ALF59368.1 hypothetical protein AOC03_04290 [Psychrobacter urativorans]